MTKKKHPQNRAERRKIKSLTVGKHQLATNRFRDHVHENETKQFKVKKFQKQQETEDGYENLDAVPWDY